MMDIGIISQLRFFSNNESDMIQVYPENISTYNAIRDGGTFMDLSEYMSDDLKEKLVGQDMCDVDGQTLAISELCMGNNRNLLS